MAKCSPDPSLSAPFHNASGFILFHFKKCLCEKLTGLSYASAGKEKAENVKKARVPLFRDLTITPYNARVCRKCIAPADPCGPAGIKAPDRKAGPIYTKIKIVYAVRRCVPWKRKIWTGPI